MKFKQSVTSLALTLILAAGVVGCKKRVQGPTPLPGRAGGLGTDELAPGVGFKDGTTGADSAGMFPTTDVDFSKWNPDPTVFRDQTIYFDFDKSSIKPSEVPKLETVASRLKSEFAGKALRVEGHCDERGTEEYNRALGERRALSVREFLIRLGIDSRRIDTVSFGEDRPVAMGHNDAAWAKNRRGELILLSPPGGGTGPVTAAPAGEPAFSNDLEPQ